MTTPADMLLVCIVGAMAGAVCGTPADRISNMQAGIGVAAFVVSSAWVLGKLFA